MELMNTASEAPGGVAEPGVMQPSERHAVARPRTSLLRVFYGLSLALAISAWFEAFRYPFWLDETVSYWQINGGFRQIWSRSIIGNCFPAHDYILWLTQVLFGSNEMVLRVPSVLAMMAAAYVLYRCARELFEQDVAMIGVIILCLDTGVRFAAIDARPYAFGVLAITTAMLALIRWMKTQRMRYAVMLGVSSALMLYFHYLLGLVLPAFVIYYLAIRRRSLRTDAVQIAVALACFGLLSLPVISRLQYLFATRSSHVFSEGAKLTDFLLLVWPAVAVLVAMAIKKDADGRRSAILPITMAVVPLGLLYGISVLTPLHIFVSRYCIQAAPGIALCGAWLVGKLLVRPVHRALATLFIVFLFTLPVFLTAKGKTHGYTWKYALEYANKLAVKEHMPVLICSDLPESDFQRMPTEGLSDAFLFAPLSYYKVDAEVVALPRSLNDEAMRVGREFMGSAGPRRQRFLALAFVPSYRTLTWLSEYANNWYVSRPIAESDGIIVMEFIPR